MVVEGKKGNPKLYYMACNYDERYSLYQIKCSTLAIMRQMSPGLVLAIKEKDSASRAPYSTFEPIQKLFPEESNSATNESRPKYKLG